ncbi:MAG: amidohydrolase family protein, partial [Candidatus Thorarchaeota archaeon]
GREKSHRNTPSGAYDFYALLWFELQKMAKTLMDEDKLLFEPIRIVAPTFPEMCFQSRTSWANMNHGWLADRTVVFPYSDDYAKSSQLNEASFTVSNDKIAGWTTRAPHSARLIGFARVDPHDASTKNPNTAVKELERSILELGLRGVKLHPIAQLFIDEIDDTITQIVVEKAAKLAIPVIFDTRNIRTIERIRSLVDSIRKSNRRLAQNLKIILAHSGMSPSDKRLYDALSDPLIYGETSSIHGLDVPILFDMAKDYIRGQHWSEKILFGTDYSFLSVQAAEVILHLLSREFPGSLSDAQAILGGNAMRIVQQPFRTKLKPTLDPLRVTSTKRLRGGLERVEKGILSLVSNGEMDISSIDFMLPRGNHWPTLISLMNGGFNGIYYNSLVVAMRSEKHGSVHLWLKESTGQFITCAVLDAKSWSLLSESGFAAQEQNASLIDSIVDSEMVNSPKQLVDRVLEYIS